MKKHILVLAIITVLFTGGFTAFAATLPFPIHIEDSIEVQFESSSYQTVQPGDTLWSIANENNVLIDDLLKWNDLDSTIIHPTQELIVNKISKFRNEIESSVKKDLETYIVKPGDTLINIAVENNLSIEELINWNTISSELILPGQELVLNGINNPSHQATLQTISIPKKPQEIAQVKTKSTSQPIAKAKVQAATINNGPGKEMTMTATAYTAYCKGCSGTTYTGINLRANPNQKVIAVDPRIIPLGSRVWVEGYGEAIAGDIGSAIKGNIIDVFIEHRQDALNWGRKTVKIKILE
ncbi:LysM peptidoglycan-binding domain-containing protein [Sporosarcina siberiensis]|uniref:LysM peptidoglycan-binding domain-containing protein n=1 Tax=Sporosarcina siberiensis TaxID=1365606 RepID=A0ABW4SGQ0_9BACL